MFKVLLKKQLLEVFSQLTTRRGKRSGGSGVVYIVLLAVAFFSLIMLFAAVNFGMAVALVPKGSAVIYFGVNAILAAIMGLIGGMMSTYNVLYCPRDNEMLLAMPIPPMLILASRMVSVLLQILYYMLPVWVSVLPVYFIVAGFSAGVLVRGLVAFVALVATVLTLACGLGWLLALISAKTGNKKIVTVISIVLSLGAYYLIYFQRARIMGLLTNEPEKAEGILKTLYPFYAYGAGIVGDWLQFLIAVAIGAALLALALFLLSRSFVSIITTKKSAKRKVYVEKQARADSAFGALFRREIRRFLTDPLYLVNNALGTVFMIVLSVLALVNTSSLRGFASGLFMSADVGDETVVTLFSGTSSRAIAAMIVAALIAFVASLTVISASAISLEGRTLWLLKSMPVSANDVLLAKAANHMLFAGAPAVLMAVCVSIAVGLSAVNAVLVALFAFAVTLFICCFGLMLESRRPKLDWTSENVAVKQNMNVLITMFVGMGVSGVAAIFIVPAVFLPLLVPLLLALETGLMIGLSVLFFRLAKRGWLRLEC